jgi:hypothetical protein
MTRIQSSIYTEEYVKDKKVNVARLVVKLLVQRNNLKWSMLPVKKFLLKMIQNGQLAGLFCLLDSKKHDYK